LQQRHPISRRRLCTYFPRHTTSAETGGTGRRARKLPLTLHPTGPYCKRICREISHFGQDEQQALPRNYQQSLSLRRPPTEGWDHRIVQADFARPPTRRNRRTRFAMLEYVSIMCYSGVELIVEKTCVWMQIQRSSTS